MLSGVGSTMNTVPRAHPVAAASAAVMYAAP